MRSRWRYMVALMLLASVPAYAALQQAELSLDVGTPLEKVTDFKAQPLALLAQFPDAGPAMARFVAKLVARQPRVAAAIVAIMPDTSPEQATAIGAGMVRAVRSLRGSQPAAVDRITEIVAQSDNIWLKTTFEALGSHYAAHTSVATAEVIPPAARSSAAIGVELPSSMQQSAPGPAAANASEMAAMDATETVNSASDSAEITHNGMIVAFIISDAARNGAVSTSPTQ